MIAGKKLSTARSFVALGALLGIVSCASAGGAGTSGDSVASAPAIPSALAIATAEPAAVAFAPAVASLQSASSASLARSVGIDDAELASLSVPLTSDVAPVGDAVEPFASGSTLSGDYHGLINTWEGSGEQKGGTTFQIDRTGSSFTGYGTARDGGFVVSVAISGTVVAQYAHSVGVELTIQATDSAGTVGCPFSGTARRYPHVFLGVLSNPQCGVVFFKVHPVSN